MNKNILNIIRTGFVAAFNSIFELFFLCILGIYLSNLFGNENKASENFKDNEIFKYIINENLFLLFLLAIVLRFCIQIFSIKYLSNKMGLIISDVRKKLFDEIVEQDTNVKFTQILESNINKINALTVNFIPALVNAISEIILLSVLLLGLVYLTQQYIVLLLIPFSLYPLYKSATKSSYLGNNRRLLEDKFVNLYDYLFHSRIEILSLGKISNIGRIFKNLSNDAINQISKHYLFTQGPKVIIELFVSLLLLTIGLLSFTSEFNLIVLLIALRIFPVLIKINGFLNQFSYSLRIIGRSFLMEYLFLKKIKPNINSKEFKLIKNIIINNGYIKYKNHTIKKISQIEFKVGKLNIIRGRSGVGKSSLIYSLLGYGNYKLNNGILIDGKYFDNLSFLTVGLYLNGGNKSIDNIVDYLTYYDINYQESIIINLMEILSLKELIESYNSSRKLSTGELQRLDLVRLLYNKSSLYILDEPTSNLDSESFKSVENQLSILSLKSLVVIVTHDNRFNLSDAIDLN